MIDLTTMLFIIIFMSLNQTARQSFRTLLTALILLRVAALYVILKEGGMEEGFIALRTLIETNK